MQICALLREALGELSFARFLAAVVDSVAQNNRRPAARHVDKYAAALERLDVAVLRADAATVAAADVAAARAAARAMRKVLAHLETILGLFDVEGKYDFDGSVVLQHSLTYAEVDCAAVAKVIGDLRCLQSPRVSRGTLRKLLNDRRQKPGDGRRLEPEDELYAASHECHRLELAAAVRARLQN
jgi:hypothetical protein